MGSLLPPAGPRRQQVRHDKGPQFWVLNLSHCFPLPQGEWASPMPRPPSVASSRTASGFMPKLQRRSLASLWAPRTPSVQQHFPRCPTPTPHNIDEKMEAWGAPLPGQRETQAQGRSPGPCPSTGHQVWPGQEVRGLGEEAEAQEAACWGAGAGAATLCPGGCQSWGSMGKIKSGIWDLSSG